MNSLAFAASALVTGLRSQSDVVLATIPTLESSFSAYLLAKLRRVPFILNIEDLWPDSIVAMGFTNKPIIAWMRLIERFLYQQADHILIIAEGMRQYLEDCGVESKKITTLPLGANIASSITARETIRERYKWSPSDIVCGYVGSHGPANDLETIIAAAKKVTDPRIRFALVGDGSDKVRLQNLAGVLGLTNLEFLDAVNPSDVPSLLRSLDIGIATLKDTQLFKAARPTKLFEYMEAGLPIVCAIDGEARDFVEAVGAGVFALPQDADDVARVIRNLASDEGRRRTMSRCGKQSILELYNRDKIAQRLQSIISEVDYTSGHGPRSDHGTKTSPVSW
jgi:glycosyltransferase involved in cell wall biosynthesis